MRSRWASTSRTTSQTANPNPNPDPDPDPNPNPNPNPNPDQDYFPDGSYYSQYYVASQTEYQVLDADAVLILRGVDFSDAQQQRAVLALVAAVEAEEHCLVPYASFLRDYLVYAAQHGLAPSGPRFYG